MTSGGKRVLSAVVFLPLFVLLLLKGTVLHFYFLVLPVSLLGLWEFFSLRRDLLPVGLKTFGFLWAAMIVTAALSGSLSSVAGCIAVGVILSLLIKLLKIGHMGMVMDEIGFLFLGVLYVAFLMSFLVLLRGIDYGNLWVLLLFFIAWGGDTAAYYTGLSFGRRRLYPEVSPKKSVEGLAGGFVGGLVASVIAKVIFFPVIGLLDALSTAAIVGLTGPLGDLSESMLKRSSGVKDSGSIIPGHGGVLDRLDSVIFSAPFVYYLAVVKFAGQG